jgi:transcriptional regulator with XRE-family HTH domain
MNQLKWIREKSGLTLRELAKYTSIRYPALSKMENELQPFKGKHIDSLTSFFGITSDFLMGKSESGIRMFTDDGDIVEFTRDQMVNAMGHFITSIQKSLVAININGEPTVCPYYVARTLEPGYFDARDIKTKRLYSDIEKMDEEQLDKTIMLVEEVILNRKI